MRLTGYVSSFEFGRCRIIKEKHFIYVNGRHIESQRLSRISNDLFGQFNKCGQRCILILFISLPSSTLDVNVTPDKRTLFLHFEKELFAKLHSTLISTFSKVQGNCSSSIVEDLIQNKSYSLSKSNRLFYDFNSSTNLLNNLKKLEKNNSENSQSSPLNSTQSTKPINKTTPIKNILSISSSSSSSSSPEHSPLNSTKNSDLISSPTFSEQNNNSSLLPITSSPSLNINYRPHQTIKINMEELKNKYLKRQKKEEKNKENNCFISIEVEELNLDEGNDNQLVRNNIEKRLSLMLKKSDFSQMYLIGQFNNAFILTRLGNNLFMIDQHAADEKYNFEMLQLNCTIKSQRLFKEKKLNFGPLDFALLKDNLELFNKNGFEFNFDDNNNNEIENEDLLTQNSSTVKLVALPNIVGHSFDKNDIDELLSLIAEIPGQLHRPTKVKSIFASKACRKSVMFGHPLSKYKMKQIIENMGKLEQPWNCPHGRPTIRHLCSINLLNI